MKKPQNITSKLYPIGLFSLVLLVWQGICMLELVPAYILPSPVNTAITFVETFPQMMDHASITLMEAFAGLLASIVLGIILALLMDVFPRFKKAFYPLIIVTQTIPSVAIAPLLVLWFGYGLFPRILLITIVCFFPIVMALFDGLKSADPDAIDMIRSMGATKLQIYRHIKMPYAFSGLFSGLKIAVTYSMVGAVISEWLGGNKGLGVYMIRVKKSYAYDKIFAVLFLIIIISLLLMWLTVVLERRFTPWKKSKQ